jgi:protein-tyrosine phosphatase
MFNIFRKSKPINFSFLNTDIHSHILPGIDDGADSIPTSIFLLNGLKALGFEKFIFTPHIYTEFYPNDKNTVQQAYQRLRAILPNENMAYSAEYFLENAFNDILKNKEIICFGQNKVLFETSTFSAPMGLEEAIFELISTGYQPILAHPERYLYFDIKDLIKFQDMGCQFQVNLLSLQGYYGPHVKQHAFKIFERGIFDYAGTDLHNKGQLKSLEKLSSDTKLMMRLSKYPWKNTTL